MKLKTLLTESNISYSAIVLDDSSKQKLRSIFFGKVPPNYEWVGDHVTICLGSMGEISKYLIGRIFDIVIVQIGLSDKAIAVKVRLGDEIAKIINGPKFPHITLAVNRIFGGKPVDSNKIEEWEELVKPITLTGIVKEIEKK